MVELISCFNLLCDVFGVQRMGNPHKSTNDWGIYAGEYSFFFWQGHLKQVQGSSVDGNGQSYSALDVADAYFRAGGAAGVAEF